MAVGKNILRREGLEKLTGAARFVDDIALEGMLYAKTVWSTIPRGIIRSVTLDSDFDWSPIIVADHRDIPGGNYVALIENDQPLLVEREVRHWGEPILLLAAEDKSLLSEAATRVKIEYDELEPVLTIEESLSARRLIHGRDNVFKSFSIRRGDSESALKHADHIIEAEYRVPHQEQLYIEPQGMIAIPEDGRMTVMGSLQCPYYVHRALKEILAKRDDEVVVIQTATGGGFGGKEEYPSNIAGHAALLALKSGRPVKLVYDRGEDILVTTKRHPGIIRCRSGFTNEGRLVSSEIDIVLDGGAYVTLTPVVLSRALIHASGPYRCDNILITGRGVATNTPPNGAFRGFGAPQVAFAYEMQMERIAASLGMDPVDVRRLNMLREGDTTATGQVLSWSVGSQEVLDAAVARSGYYERKRSLRLSSTGAKKSGIGISLFFHGAGFTGSGEAKMKAAAGLEITRDGRARVLSGSTEIGQGTITIFSQIVAEELGLAIDQVDVVEPNTSLVPDSGPTVASRTCMIVGRVIQLAARELREKILRFAAERHGDPDIEIRDGAFISGAGHVAAMADIASEYIETRGELRSILTYTGPPGLAWDDDSYTGDAYPVFSWGADVVEVEIDMDTYEVSVRKITTAEDLGRAIHPTLAAGQIEGGTLQALGYGLLEDLVWDGGRVLNNRLTNYLIPTSMDAPEIDTVIVEKEYPFGPFGAKGVGELPMDGGAPAIAAAIHDAVGVFVNRLPITPERLQAALEESIP